MAPNIESEFEKILEAYKILGTNAPEHQISHMRSLFFAGIMYTLGEIKESVQKDHDDPGPGMEHMVDLLITLSDQCAQYRDKIIAGIGKSWRA